MSGAWYWHFGQHRSGSSSDLPTPESLTATTPGLRKEEAGGTVLKGGAPGNMPGEQIESQPSKLS